MKKRSIGILLAVAFLLLAGCAGNGEGVSSEVGASSAPETASSQAEASSQGAVSSQTVVSSQVSATSSASKPVSSSGGEFVTSQSSRPQQSRPSNSDPNDGIITLMALGDNLFHESVYKDGLQSDGTYRYEHYYEYLKDEIAGADIAVINQETLIGGKKLGYSGWPAFNSPDEVGHTLVDLGFDVVTMANNHMLDKGEAGVLGNVSFWKKNYPDILVPGVYESKADRDTIRILEREGVKIAFLAYTYGANGNKCPAGKGYLLNFIDRDLIRKDVERAKELADGVILALHWGIEYRHQPTAEQKSLAQFCADLGVTAIIGTHPHVVEPVEWLTGKSGNKMLCYYSLGNLISSQVVTETMMGAMAKFSLKMEDGKLVAFEESVIPTICHYVTVNDVRKTFKLYPYEMYTAELAAQHGIKAYDSALTMKWINNTCEQVFGKYFEAK